MSKDIERYVSCLFSDNEFVELRALSDEKPFTKIFSKSGRKFFEPIAGFWETAAEFNGAGNVYSSLNRPHEPIKGRPLRDRDIAVITRLPLDFDPVRPKNCPSTAGELARARLVRNAVVGALRAAGFPIPVIGDSGNGAHAMYRCNILNDEDWRHAAEALYRWMEHEFKGLCEQNGVKFDTSVRNPSRMWRLYGTVNRKGTATADRPHREATCIYPASGWQQVSLELLQDLVNRWRPPRNEPRSHTTSRAVTRGKGDYRTLDVVGWFQARGSYIRPTSREGIHAVFCPWNGEHTTKGGVGETVIFENLGSWPQFFCNHAHCNGRRIADVMILWGDADAFCGQEFVRGVRS